MQIEDVMKKFFTLCTLLLMALVCNAGDVQIDSIWYDVNPKRQQAEVIAPPYDDNYYSGDIIIPEKVSHNGTEYMVTSIGNRAFYECSSLTGITLPNSVTSIGEEAFLGCTGLTSITLPDSVTSIGFAAFGICSNLASITLGNSVTSIGGRVFSSCTNLTGITLPNSVTSIGEYAFTSCTSLTSITIPNSVTSIGFAAFGICTSLTSITIPNSVTSIGENAFRECSGLSQIIVEEGNPIYDSRDNCNAIIETATNTLLSGCQSTIIPNSVTTIRHGAFIDCSSLTSITIPNSVKNIGMTAFAYCSSLTSIIIPSSVKNIEAYAFAYCSSLTSVYCYAEKAPMNASNPFEHSPIESATLYVPASSIEDYKITEPWNNFGTIILMTEEEIQSIDSKESTTVIIQAHDGNIVLQGAEAGTIVSIYAANGMKVASGIVGVECMLTLPTGIPTGEMVIVQVGAQSMKVLMK